MLVLRHSFAISPLSRLAPCVLAVSLAACTVGPDFVKPAAQAPDDWTSWRSSQEALSDFPGTTAALPSDWWQVFADPVLNELEQRAFAQNPDLRTATLHVAQARVQSGVTASQGGPELDASGGITRERLSENGTTARQIDLLGANHSLMSLMSRPFNLYQAGFDVSWEPDLWGRVSRSVEAAQADIANQDALLDLARLSLASDVARNYFEMRNTQSQIQLLREDIAAFEERDSLQATRAQAGVIDHLGVETLRTDLASQRAQLPGLLAQEAASANQIALLLGEHPGQLKALLKEVPYRLDSSMPDLTLGVPSEIARRRPDIRAAEARLHRATANIGVAQADLYPSLRLGASLGFDSYRSGDFAAWGSRNWSLGPTLSLPLFDRGRRKGEVQLRELEQQEAAISFHKTVLGAWQEIDDALSAYSAEAQQEKLLETRVGHADEAYRLSAQRYAGGITSYLAVLDARRTVLQARRDLLASRERLYTRYVTVNKAIGNVSTPPIGGNTLAD